MAEELAGGSVDDAGSGVDSAGVDVVEFPLWRRVTAPVLSMVSVRIRPGSVVLQVSPGAALGRVV